MKLLEGMAGQDTAITKMLSDSTGPDIDPEDVERAQRLKRIRGSRGYRSATAFAETHGLNKVTYHHHENGRRRLGVESARLYATILQISVEELLYGGALQPKVRIPIIGTLVDGGRVQAMPVPAPHGPDAPPLYPDHRNGDIAIAAPAPRRRRSAMPTLRSGPAVEQPDFSAMRVIVVADMSMYPAYRQGDMLFFRAMTPQRTLDKRLHGVECVVMLTDGRILVRTVTIQIDGKATLIGYSTPPIFDAEITEAARVEWCKRAGPAER